MLEMIWAVAAIILIDIVLAGDNALVISMAANRLPADLRKRAIIWGTVGAIAVRFICVLALTWLLLIPGLRVVGGAVLLYIAWKLAFMSKDHEVDAKDTFWGAMATIVVADAVMGLDNALAIAAAANGNIWLVIFGLLVSVPLVLFGSQLISKILERYPDMVFIGSFVLFVVALQMIFKEPTVHAWWTQLEDWAEKAAPWVLGVFLTAKQYYRARIIT